MTPALELERDADSPLCRRCGHSWRNHTRGLSPAMFCRHCPCEEYVERGVGRVADTLPGGGAGRHFCDRGGGDTRACK